MAPDSKRGGGLCSRPLARRMLFAIMVVVLGAVVGGSPLPKIPDDGGMRIPGYAGDDAPRGNPLPHHPHENDAAANRLARRFESVYTGDSAAPNLARRAENHAGGRDTMEEHYKRSLGIAHDVGSPDLRRRRGIRPPATNPYHPPGESPGPPGNPPILRRDTTNDATRDHYVHEDGGRSGGQLYRRSGSPGGDEFIGFHDQQHRARDNGAPGRGSLTRRDISATGSFEEEALLVRRNQNDDYPGIEPSPPENDPPGIGGGKSAHNHVHRRNEGENRNPEAAQSFGKLVRREWLGQNLGSNGSGGGAQGPGGPGQGQDPRHGKRSKLYRRERDHGLKLPSEHDLLGDADAPGPLFRRDHDDPHTWSRKEWERYDRERREKEAKENWTPAVPVDPHSGVHGKPLVRRDSGDDMTSDTPELYPRDVLNEEGKRVELSERKFDPNDHDPVPLPDPYPPLPPPPQPKNGGHHHPPAKEQPLHRRDQLHSDGIPYPQPPHSVAYPVPGHPHAAGRKLLHRRDVVNDWEKEEELFKRVPDPKYDDLRPDPQVPWYHGPPRKPPAAERQPLRRRYVINDWEKEEELFKRKDNTFTPNPHDITPGPSTLNPPENKPWYEHYKHQPPAAEQKPLHRRDVIDQKMGREALYKRDDGFGQGTGEPLTHDPWYGRGSLVAQSKMHAEEHLQKRQREAHYPLGKLLPPLTGVPGHPHLPYRGEIPSGGGFLHRRGLGDGEGGELDCPPEMYGCNPLASIEARSERYAAPKHIRRDVLDEAEVLMNKRHDPPSRPSPHGWVPLPHPDPEWKPYIGGGGGPGSGNGEPANPGSGAMAKDWQLNLAIQF
ncbi:uncharacterized protein UTRI_05760_B [Ustilago trichophora]|uniref:Uncharacterized protein n=1 Tax=Ustilago trichophora TaxID=86804 RepID=A0A5C3EQD6_9BASI|nr:uncharacterized protein UTRI_05760_B [Ustilago trichophora]